MLFVACQKVAQIPGTKAVLGLGGYYMSQVFINIDEYQLLDWY
jgi:hypothetical protein